MILFYVYLFSLALGGVLILASIFLGDSHGADTHVDGHLDVHTDIHVGDHAEGGDHDGDGWLPFVSLRFWTFALASFGLTGTLLHLLSIHPFASLAVSLVAGLGIGFGVATLFRYLKRGAATATTPARDLRGMDGLVLLSIGPGKIGKIRLRVDGQDVDLPANTRESTPLQTGTPALVVDVQDGVAEVVPMEKAATTAD